MKAQVFVPLYDDLMYDHPELIEGPICAFDPDGIVVFTSDDYARGGPAKINAKGKPLSDMGFKAVSSS
ncbi:MAG: hypothetical protein VW546_02545 [Gammaproteobacteria bacterium]